MPTLVLENANARFNGSAYQIDPSLLVPETWKETVLKYGKDTIVGMTEFFKQEEPTKQDTFSWEEKGSIFSSFTTSTAVTGSGGNTVNLTIQNNATNYLNGGTVSVVKEQDKLRFKNDIVGVVTAVDRSVASAHVITVQPYIGNITTLVGDRIIIYGNERKKGDVGAGSVFNVPYEKSNNCVILSEGYELDGSSVTLETITSQMDVNGVPTNVIMYAQQADLFKRFAVMQDMHLLVDQKATNAGVATFGTVGSRGLLPDVEANGIVSPFTIATPSTTLDAIDTMIDSMISERTPEEVMIKGSSRYRLNLDKAILNYPGFTNGGVVYNAFNNDKEMAVGFGFDTFRRGSYTFHIGTLSAFDHPDLLGATGQKYRQAAVMMPTGMVKNSEGQSEPIFMVRYKKGKAADRRIWHRLTGGAPGIVDYTNDQDIIKCTYNAHIGPHANRINQWGIMIGV